MVAAVARLRPVAAGARPARQRHRASACERRGRAVRGRGFRRSGLHRRGHAGAAHAAGGADHRPGRGRRSGARAGRARSRSRSVCTATRRVRPRCWRRGRGARRRRLHRRSRSRREAAAVRSAGGAGRVRHARGGDGRSQRVAGAAHRRGRRRRARRAHRAGGARRLASTRRVARRPPTADARAERAAGHGADVATTATTSTRSQSTCGLTVAEVVDLHSGAEYTVRVLRLHARVRLSRRPPAAAASASPRHAAHPGAGRLGRHRRRVHAPCTRGRARAAGTCSAHRLGACGTTPASPPALLPPGTRVQVRGSDDRRSESWGIGGLGRRTPVVPGSAWLGASRGGAVDLVSLALANRLVGNPETAIGFETSGGLAFSCRRAHDGRRRPGPSRRSTVDDGPPVGWGSPVVLPAGATRPSRSAARRCPGVRRRPRRPDRTRGRAAASVPIPSTPAAEHAAPRRQPLTERPVWPGPRRDWFDADAWVHLLASAEFTVTATSRVGTRLVGRSAAERVRPERAAVGGPGGGRGPGAARRPADRDARRPSDHRRLPRDRRGRPRRHPPRRPGGAGSAPLTVARDSCAS